MGRTGRSGGRGGESRAFQKKKKKLLGTNVGPVSMLKRLGSEKKL